MNRDKLLAKYFAIHYSDCYPHKQSLVAVGRTLGFAWYVFKYEIKRRIKCKD